MNTKAVRNGLTDDVLREEYGSGRTSRDISKKYGLTENGVLYRLRKLGIVKSNRQRNAERMVNKDGRSIFSLSPAELDGMLRERSERDIAREYNCSRQVLKSLREKFGVKAYSKSDRIEAALPDWFSDEQVSVLYGSMLGDGNIHLCGNRTTARFKEGHSVKQDEYVRWKASVLGDFVSRRGARETSVKKWRDGRRFRTVLVLSKYHRNFKIVHDWFYDANGMKHVPANFAGMITPLAIAVWYMDDGSLHGNKPTIASCLDRSELDRACIVMERKFGIKSFIPDRRPGDSVYIIHFDRETFFKAVGDYVLPEMAYKVSLRERFSIKCIGRPDLLKYVGAGPIRIDVENMDELSDYCHIAGFPYPRLSDYDRGAIVEKIRNSPPMIEDGVIRPGNGIGNDFLICCFENYFLAHSYGRWPAMWQFDNNLVHVLRNLMEEGKPLTWPALRAELMDLSGIYGFRPAVAMQIYDRYCQPGARVLDPCGGWGGRMLGAYCSGAVARYDCVDACAGTKHGLDHVKMLMDRTTGSGTEVNVSFGAYEDMEFDAGSYDMVFTSPPYFIKEFYSDDPEQSGERYGDDFGKWTDGFLRPFVGSSLAWLRKGGKFVVNIGNISLGRERVPVADAFRSIVEHDHAGDFRHVETLRMARGDRYGNGSDGRDELVLVYEKTLDGGME